jgi:hypothetical protein
LKITKTISSIKIENNGPEIVDKYIITDGSSSILLGSFNVKDLALFIIQSGHPEIPNYFRIYNYITAAFDHYCSNGTTSDKGSAISKLYSFSFGCCSDINDPVLSNLLAVSGYPVNVISSPHHVAVEINNSSPVYLDSDYKFFIQDNISNTDYLSFSNRVFKLGQYENRQVTTNNINKDTVHFNLYTKDFVEFTSKPVSLSRLLLRKQNSGKPFKNENHNKLAHASLNMAQFKTLNNTYKVNLPYFLLDGSIKINGKGKADIFIEGDTYNKKKEINISKYINGKDSFEFTSNYDEEIILNITFQYNSKIHPTDFRKIEVLDHNPSPIRATIKDISTLTINLKDFGNNYKFYGNCDSDVTLFGYSVKRLKCENSTWSYEFKHFDGSRGYFNKKDWLSVGVSSISKNGKPINKNLKLKVNKLRLK